MVHSQVTRTDMFNILTPLIKYFSIVLLILSGLSTTIFSQCVEPSVTVYGLASSCTLGNVNNDGYLQISNAENATHFDWNIGNTYTGVGFAGASPFNALTDLPLRFGQLPNPTGTQDYIVRIFNSNDCFTDTVVTIDEQTCQTECECQEVIYLNEPVIGAVLKFIINPDGSLTEVQGANGGQYWYPDNLTSELPDPHGLATDINGFLYIGANFTPNNPIRKFTCDGTIFPEVEETITHPYVLTNIFSLENTLYTTKGGGIASFDICSGDELGTVCYNDINGNMVSQANSTQNVYWGLSYNRDTELVYATGVQNNNQGAQGIWRYTIEELDAALSSGDCIDPFIWEDDTRSTADLNAGDSYIANDLDRLNGIVSDNDGNIFLSGWYEPEDDGFVYKYNSNGEYITHTAINTAYSLSRGIIWSQTMNSIYVANQTDVLTTDCISRFDADDLSYIGTAAANPNLPDNNSGKAMASILECCPTINRQNIDINLCVTDGADPIYISEIYGCQGVVCEGNWGILGDLSPVIVYDECTQSVTLTGDNGNGGTGGSACATFINQSDGDSTTDQCGAYEIILNVQFVLMPEISLENKTTCAGSAIELSPSFNFVDNNANYTYNWFASSTNCNGSFSQIAGQTLSTLTVAPSVETTYRVVVDMNVGCVPTSCSVTACSTVSVDPAPLVSILPTTELSCNNPILTLTGSGTAGSTFSWTTTDGNIISGATTGTPQVDQAGTYTLELEGANGCKSITPATVIVSGEACCDLGGNVFVDADNDGCRLDADDIGVGIFGVELYLCDSSGSPSANPIATAITTSDGRYDFGPDENGSAMVCLSSSENYTVKFVFPDNGSLSDFVFSTIQGDDSCDIALSNDLDSATGLISYCIDPSGDDDDLHIDAAIRECIELTGTVFYDINNDGCQDGGDEVGVSGFNVFLHQCDASGDPIVAPLATTTTDASGNYTFAMINLNGDMACLDPSLKYTVSFGFPDEERFDNYFFSSTIGGGSCTNGASNDINGTTGISNACYTPGSDDSTHVDAGIWTCQQIGGTVYYDIDNNGCQDSGETGVSGFDVELYECTANGNLSGSALASTVTDNNGNYQFRMSDDDDSGFCLDPSLTYTVQFDFPSSGIYDDYNFSSTEANESCLIESQDNINPATGIANQCYNPLSSVERNHIDAGIWECESISGLVFYDNNNNGCQDAGESIVQEDVTVVLYECAIDGSPMSEAVATTTTINGQYEFSNSSLNSNAKVCLLSTKEYLVKFVLPNSTGQTLADYVFTSAEALASCQLSGNADDVDPVTGQSDCVVPRASSSEDDHINAGIGYFDLALIAVANVTSQNIPGDDIPFIITVYNQGTIDATNITINNYLPSGLSFNPNINLGWSALGSTLTYVIDDLVAGQTETLQLILRLDDVSDPSETLNYTEIVSAQDGLGNGVVDVDSTPGSNSTEELSVIPGDPNDNKIDGGGLSVGEDEDDHDASGNFDLVGCLSNRVWKDCDGDGIQDFGEDGFENVKVLLYNSSHTLLGLAITDVDGAYVFEGLVSGDYYIRIELPESWLPTLDNQGNNELTDSDITGSNGLGTTDLFAIQSGEECSTNTLYDAGLYQCSNIGETIWYDANNNNVQDQNENGVNGVLVEIFRLENQGYELYDAVYSGHKPGTPSDDGYWKACVMPGTYYIKYNVPSIGLTFVTANIGGDDTIDSDVTGTFGRGTTRTFSVSCGEENCNIGAGLEPMSIFGSRVWYDMNANGQIDLNEEGIEGVEVKAFNDLGEFVDMTITDKNGNYEIDYLQERKYYAEFVPPAGLVSTIPNSVDDTIDSDIDHSHGLNTTALFETKSGETISNIDAGFRSNAILSNFWLGTSVERKDQDNYINWSVTNDEEITNYQLQKIIDNQFVTIEDLSSNQLSTVQKYTIIDRNATENGEYLYQIIAQKTNGEQEISEIMSIIVNQFTADDLEVHPNPAKDQVSIIINNRVESAHANVSIKDVTGRYFISNNVLDDNLSIGTHEFSIDITNIPEGLYILEILLDDQQIDQKIIIFN